MRARVVLYLTLGLLGCGSAPPPNPPPPPPVCSAIATPTAHDPTLSAPVRVYAVRCAALQDTAHALLANVEGRCVALAKVLAISQDELDEAAAEPGEPIVICRAVARRMNRMAKGGITLASTYVPPSCAEPSAEAITTCIEACRVEGAEPRWSIECDSFCKTVAELSQKCPQVPVVVRALTGGSAAEALVAALQAHLPALAAAGARTARPNEEDIEILLRESTRLTLLSEALRGSSSESTNACAAVASDACSKAAYVLRKAFGVAGDVCIAAGLRKSGT